MVSICHVEMCQTRIASMNAQSLMSTYVRFSYIVKMPIRLCFQFIFSSLCDAICFIRSNGGARSTVTNMRVVKVERNIWSVHATMFNHIFLYGQTNPLRKNERALRNLSFRERVCVRNIIIITIKEYIYVSCKRWKWKREWKHIDMKTTMRTNLWE